MCYILHVLGILCRPNKHSVQIFSLMLEYGEAVSFDVATDPTQTNPWPPIMP